MEPICFIPKKLKGEALETNEPNQEPVISLEDRKREKELRNQFEEIERQKEQVRQDIHKVADGITLKRRTGAWGSTRTIPVTLSYLAKLDDSLRKMQSSVTEQMWTKTTRLQDGTEKSEFFQEGYLRAHDWLTKKGYWKKR